MRSVRVLSASIALVIVSGCADYNWKLPGVYRIPVQQGTVIEQAMVSKLKAGMPKDQVKFIMGTPVIVDPFHSNRWEYIYTYKKGSDRVREQRHITLHFDDNEQLAYISGDIAVVDPELLAQPAPEANKQPESFEVPDRPKPGFFSRLIDRQDYDEAGVPSDGGDTAGAETETGAQEEIPEQAEEDIDVIENTDGGPAGGDY